MSGEETRREGKRRKRQKWLGDKRGYTKKEQGEHGE